MAELKTKPTKASVSQFLKGVEDDHKRRARQYGANQHGEERHCISTMHDILPLFSLDSVYC